MKTAILRIMAVTVFFFAKGSMASDELPPLPENERAKLTEWAAARAAGYQAATCAVSVASAAHSNFAALQKRVDDAQRAVLESRYAVLLIRTALRDPKLVSAALDSIDRINQTDLSVFFDDMLPSSVSYGDTFQNRMQKLIRTRVSKATIEEKLEPGLRKILADEDIDTGTWVEAIRFAQELAPDVADNLIRTALSATREEIREVGRDFRK